MVRPRKSTWLTPKWHFGMASLNPALLMHLKTSRILLVNSVASLEAIPMSSTYCAHRSAFITGSKYSLIKLEKAHSERLSPCAILLYAKVRLANIECEHLDWLVICHLVDNGKLGNNQVYKRVFFPAMCCAQHPSTCSLGDYCLYRSSDMRLLIFRRSTRRRNFPLGFLRAKMRLAYFEQSRVVIIEYLCSNANSTVIIIVQMYGSWQTLTVRRPFIIWR